MTEYKVLEL